MPKCFMLLNYAYQANLICITVRLLHGPGKLDVTNFTDKRKFPTRLCLCRWSSELQKTIFRNFQTIIQFEDQYPWRMIFDLPVFPLPLTHHPNRGQQIHTSPITDMYAFIFAREIAATVSFELNNATTPTDSMNRLLRIHMHLYKLKVRVSRLHRVNSLLLVSATQAPVIFLPVCIRISG